MVFLIKKYVKIPQTVAGLMPILVLPLLGTLISGLMFYYVLGSLVAMINGAITDFLVGMSDSSGLILGGLLGLMRIDMGGPCAQAAYAFSSSLVANGVYGPMAATMVSGMTPPVGVALAVFLAKKRFTGAELQAARTAGSVVSGALAVFFGCQMPIPHGGVFAVPFCEKPFMFLLAFVIGCLVTAVILIALKPKKAEDSQDIEAEFTEEIEFTI